MFACSDPLQRLIIRSVRQAAGRLPSWTAKSYRTTALMLCASWLFAAPGLAQPGSASAANPQARELAFRSMPARSLVSAWPTAAREERPLIEDALFSQRAKALAALRTTALEGSTDERMFACGLLGFMRDGDAVPTLLKAVRDPDEKVRTRAVTALRMVGNREALPGLRELAAMPIDGSLLKVAIAALGTLGGTEDIPRIRPYLSHPDENVRVMAAGALGMLGSYEGESTLLAATRSDDSLASKNAAYGLGYIDTTASTERLQSMIDDPNGTWKSYASIALQLHALRRMSTTDETRSLAALAQNSDSVVSLWAIERLAELATAGGKESLAGLAAGTGRPATAARRTLAALGNPIP